MLTRITSFQFRILALLSACLAFMVTPAFAAGETSEDLFDAATSQLTTISASVIAVLIIAIGIGAIYMVYRHVRKAMGKA